MNKPDAIALITKWAADQVGAGIPGQFDARDGVSEWKRMAEAFDKLGHVRAAERARLRAKAIEDYLAEEVERIKAGRI